MEESLLVLLPLLIFWKVGISRNHHMFWQRIHSSSDEGLSGMQPADLSIIERILIGAFVFGIIGLFTIIGVITPGVGWFLYLFP